MKGGGLVTWGTLLLAAPSLVSPAGFYNAGVEGGGGEGRSRSCGCGPLITPRRFQSRFSPPPASKRAYCSSFIGKAQ